MTDKLREAAQQALEALKQAKDAVSDWGLYANEYFQQKHDLQGDLDAIQAQITALRAALAEQPVEQESDFIEVAWQAGYTDGARAERSEYDALLRQALEALVDARVRPPHKQDSSKYDAAIAALRERIGEQT